MNSSNSQFRIDIIAVMVVIMAVFFTQESWACQPSRYADPIFNNLIISDIAFIGTVTEIEQKNYMYQLDSVEAEIPMNIVTFDVHSKWKGNLADTITLYFSDFFCDDNHFIQNTPYFVLVSNADSNSPFMNSLYSHVKLTDNVGLNFIKIVLRFLIDPFVLISLLIVIPTIVGIVIFKKRKRRDLK